MKRGGRASPGRIGAKQLLLTHPLEELLTGAAFVILHVEGLIGPVALAPLMGLLALAAITNALGRKYCRPGCSSRQLHLRMAMETAATTTIIYAIGWGPTLAVGYVVVIADDLQSAGSSVWKPGLAWSCAGIGVGQLAIALGIAPTYVKAPFVHGLAVLAALGLAFVVRLLGLKTQAVEREVAERLQAERAARLSEERFRSLVQNSLDVVTVVDAGGNITYVTPSIERVFGRSPDTYLGRNGFDHIHPDDVAASRALLESMLANPGEIRTIELRAQDAQGNWRWCEVTVQNLLDDPAVKGIVANWSDVTERRTHHDLLAHEARHDELTGLANRKAFLERLEQAMAQARRHHRCVALLFFDLDRFKLVNDSLGHGLGDRLLTEIARRLLACVRAGDTVARFAGDEFTVLLEHVEGLEGARALAERITEHLREPIMLGARDYVVTASVGVAVSTDGQDNPEDLLCHADLAMYAAKEDGRARTAVFDERSTPQFVERVDLEAGLRAAIARGEFVLHYQPVVALPGGELTGFEALARWLHPGRGLLGPDAFIKLAEDNAMIVPIGRWIMEEACRTLSRWCREPGFPKPLTMSVNVSAVQLGHPGFVEEVDDALTMAGIDPSWLVLEITESVLLHPETIVPVLGHLHELGVKLALDDFGTGFSSLNYLRELPLDFVKIDRSFVSNVHHDGPEQAIVKAVAALTHTLGFVTVAEGVETAEQAEVVWALGCRLAQGHLFSRALPAQAAGRLVSDQARVQGVSQQTAAAG